MDDTTLRRGNSPTNGDSPRESTDYETNLQRPQNNVKSHGEKQRQGQPSKAYYVVEEEETSSEEEEAPFPPVVKEKRKSYHPVTKKLRYTQRCHS